MSFFLLAAFAFLTKYILESSLVKGMLGFLKTYFIYGGVITFLFVFVVIWFSINGVTEISGGAGSYKLVGVIKSIVTILGFYYIMLSIALYNVSKKTHSIITRFACKLFILSFIFCAGLSIWMTLINSIIYLLLTVCFYKFVWRKEIVEVLRSAVIAR